MIYVALGFGITAYFLFLILFGNKYMDKLIIEKRVQDIEKYGLAKKNVEEEELSKPVRERILRPLSKKIINFTLKIVPKEDNESLKKQLVQGGVNMTVDEFNAARILVILLLGAVMFFSRRVGGTPMSGSLIGGLFGVIAGYAAVTFWLRHKISKRRDSINMQLPEVMDLLSISVEAGLGFDQALKEVSENFEGPLIDEFNTVKREMQLGKTKRAALHDMAERCNVEDLSLFVSAIVQGEQFGISLKNILRTQSYSIRLRQKQRIEQKAAKLPVKIILPVAAFIFPVLFIVVLGPTLFNLLESMKGF